MKKGTCLKIICKFEIIKTNVEKLKQKYLSDKKLKTGYI